MQRILIAAAGLAVAFSSNGAQQLPQVAIPVRDIGRVVATSAEHFGYTMAFRETRTGHVILSSYARRQVLALDSNLNIVRIVIDSTVPVGLGTSRATSLIPRGDSTLYVDLASRSLMVIGSDGSSAGTVAPPRQADLQALAYPSMTGRAVTDNRGRLIYALAPLTTSRRTTLPDGSFLTENLQADSAPIVRGDFEKRVIDTAIWLKVTPPTSMSYLNRTGQPVTVRVKTNPLPIIDQWALLPNGTIAVVRSADYRVDWVSVDGARHSTGRMPMDWRRVPEEGKAALIDTVVEIARRNLVSQSPGTTFEVVGVPPSELPDYYPALANSASVFADSSGNLWTMPRTSYAAGSGFVYDVINPSGTVVERVRLPRGRILLGFGGHSAYLSFTDSTRVTRIERALLK